MAFDLATAPFVGRYEDALFLGPPGTGKSHLAQAIGQAVITRGCRVVYLEAHILLEEIADTAPEGTRRKRMELLASLLIIDDLGTRTLPSSAAEDRGETGYKCAGGNTKSAILQGDPGANRRSQAILARAFFAGNRGQAQEDTTGRKTKLRFVGLRAVKGLTMNARCAGFGRFWGDD